MKQHGKNFYEFGLFWYRQGRASAPKFPRTSPIGWASDRQSDEQSSILCIRSIIYVKR
jgi:hypothetical protein